MTNNVECDDVPFIEMLRRHKKFWIEYFDRAWTDLKKTTRYINGSGRIGNPNSTRISGEIRTDEQVAALHEATIRWFESDVDYPGSFVWVCSVLDSKDLPYRPEEIRQRARDIVVCHFEEMA